MSLESMKQQYEEGGRSHATARAYINALEADRDEWMAEADLNLRTLIGCETQRQKAEARYADVVAEHENELALRLAAEAQIQFLTDEFSNNNWKVRAEQAEAENERLTWDRNKYQLYEVWASANAARADKNFLRAEQAEAELAALKTALRLAAGELSTYGDHTTQHPQEVYDDLVKAARAEEGGES